MTDLPPAVEAAFDAVSNDPAAIERIHQITANAVSLVLRGCDQQKVITLCTVLARDGRADVLTDVDRLEKYYWNCHDA